MTEATGNRDTLRVIARESVPGAGPWNVDLNDCEDWLETYQLPEAVCMEVAAGFQYWMLLSRRQVEQLIDVLTVDDQHRVGSNKWWEDLLFNFNEDLRVMASESVIEVADLGVHPWCFGKANMWEFWNLQEGDVERLVSAIRAEPLLNEPLVLSTGDTAIHGGFAGSARMLVHALKSQNVTGELHEIQLSLQRWLDWSLPLRHAEAKLNQAAWDARHR